MVHVVHTVEVVVSICVVVSELTLGNDEPSEPSDEVIPAIDEL